MIVKEVVDCLDEFAPLCYAEKFDNVGLILGDYTQKVNGILVTLDSTESVIDEAIKSKCNLIISFHPIIFNDIKSITTKTYVDRVIHKTIKNNISITGEIDLDGNALQIGGLVDKLYGAKNAGIKIALFPKDNINDFKKIKMEYPDLIKKGEFEAYSISNIYEALEYLLCDNKITFSNYLEKYNNIYK